MGFDLGLNQLLNTQQYQTEVQNNKNNKQNYLNKIWTSLFKKVNTPDVATGSLLIDKQTQGELNNLLQGTYNSSKYNQANTLYASAIEGIDPKFKSRMASQQLTEHLLDIPGQNQTRMGSLLDAYKGKIK